MTQRDARSADDDLDRVRTDDARNATDPTQGRQDPGSWSDPGRSGPQAGQLGSAGGGYGTGSADGTSAGSPDGEQRDRSGMPGPQTDWLRSAVGRAAPGGGESPEGDPTPHGGPARVEPPPSVRQGG